MEINEIQNRKTIEKINESKNSYFKKINKIVSSLPRLTKEKREDTTYQYQTWKRGHHYRPNGHKQNDKRILKTTLYPQI